MKKEFFASRLRAWFIDLPIQDPVERRMAALLQVILIGLIAVVVISTIVLVADPNLDTQAKLDALTGNFFGFLVVALPLSLLRRGYFRSSALIIIIILFVTPALAVTFVFDLSSGGGILIQFTLAIILSGLLVSQRTMVFVFGLSAGLVAFSAFQGQSAEPRLARLSMETAINFILFNGLIALFIDQFRITLRMALTDALARETELQSEITERKQAEERIRYQADLLENVSDAIIATDPDFYITHWNQAAESMYGWQAEEVIGKQSRDILKTEYLEEPEGSTRERLQQKGVWRGEVIQQRKDGTRINVLASVSLLKGENDRITSVLGVNRDITARKQAEEQGRFQANLVANVSDAIIAVDMQLSIQSWNPAAEAMYGWSAKEVIGQPARGILETDFLETTREAATEQITEKGHWLGEVLQQRRDGTRIPILSSLSLYKDSEGKPAGIVAVNRDISESKHVEEKLRRQNQRLKVLREIDTAILASDSVENIVRAALDHIRELLHCERANLALIEWEKNEAVNFDVRDIKESTISKGARVSLDLIQDILQVLSRNQPIIIDDLTTLPDPLPQIKIFIKEGLRSRCILPLFSQGKLIGSFTLSSKIPGYFDEEKINLGREVANQVAIAITQNNLLKALREINSELEQRVTARTAELSEANSLLEAMLDNIPDQIYFKDTQSRFIRNSRSQAYLMGLNDPSEVIGKSDFDFFPHAQRSFDEEQALMRTDQPLIDLEENVVWPDGHVTWVSTTKVPLRDAEGQITGIMGISRDITERKRAEEEVRRLNLELEKNQKDVQSILDTMATLNAKVTPDGRLLFVNKIALQASGLSMEELMNTNFLEGQWWTFDPKVQARVKEAFAKACSGTTINYDEKIYAFGRVLAINFSLTPMLGNDDSVEYILAEGRDITELKKLTEILEQRRIALEVTNKELEAFSYSVSHDLRAPLRAINGFSQALSGKYKDVLGEQGQHYLNRIQQNASQMGQLIDDLLSLSRISRREMKQDVVNITELAREIDQELRVHEPERQVLFEVEEQLEANGDAGLIRIVLQNLLINAWKFTSTRPQAHIRLGIQKGAWFVQDNGVGFDMTFANKLFGAFQRLHSTTEFPGTGIGLATVQRIIHRHGGKIWAEAELEKGATFYFTLGDADET